MFASKFFRVVLLPLGLSLAVVLGLGCFLETNDDQHFALLFQGITTGAPVPALPLYFHGLGHALSRLYAALPAVPWLGLLLAGLLAVATVLTFAVLDRLLRHWLPPAQLVLALSVFFLLAWVEHWLWFSHMRVAMLLAGAAVLYASQRPGRRLALTASLLLVLLAWLIRPAAAALAVLAAAPAAWLLAGSWPAVRPALLSAAGVLAVAFAALTFTRSPAQSRFRAIDSSLAAVVDYDLRRPAPQRTDDSLLVAAVEQWMLGDASLVTEEASRRAYVLDVPHYLRQVLPAKLGARLALLARDYFAMLLLIAGTAWWAGKRRAMQQALLMQCWYGGLLLALAALLKLPPRLALPLLDFWLLANLAVGVRQPVDASAHEMLTWIGRRWRLILGAISIVCLLYGAKTWHRRQFLQQERGQHERAIAGISRRTGTQIRVMAGADDLLKSLSPFRTYTFGPGPLVWLTGWPSYDPAQEQLYYRLAGSTQQAACLLALARRPAGEVTWILTTPTSQWLNRWFRYHQPQGSSTVGPVRCQLKPGPAVQNYSQLRYHNIELTDGVY